MCQWKLSPFPVSLSELRKLTEPTDGHNSINLTETGYSLAMITKAGVPAAKVVVGISSYGRSFGMTDPTCTGPECLFNGPNSTGVYPMCAAFV